MSASSFSHLPPELRMPMPFKPLGYERLAGYFTDGDDPQDLLLAIIGVEESERQARVEDLLLLKRLAGLTIPGCFVNPRPSDFVRAIHALVEGNMYPRGQGYILTYVPSTIAKLGARGIQYEFDPVSHVLRFPYNRPIELPKVFEPGTQIILGYDPSVGTEMVFGKK